MRSMGSRRRGLGLMVWSLWFGLTVAAAPAAAAIAPVAAAAASKPAPAAPAAPAAPTPKASEAKPTASPLSGGDRRVKMNRMRVRIAERMKESQNTAASLTTFNEIDMRCAFAGSVAAVGWGR